MAIYQRKFILEEILWINKANWNILVTLGKEIKRDSISSVNENRWCLISKMDCESVWI